MFRVTTKFLRPSKLHHSLTPNALCVAHTDISRLTSSFRLINALPTREHLPSLASDTVAWARQAPKTFLTLNALTWLILLNPSHCDSEHFSWPILRLQNSRLRENPLYDMIAWLNTESCKLHTISLVIRCWIKLFVHKYADKVWTANLKFNRQHMVIYSILYFHFSISAEILAEWHVEWHIIVVALWCEILCFKPVLSLAPALLVLLRTAKHKMSSGSFKCINLSVDQDRVWATAIRICWTLLTYGRLILPFECKCSSWKTNLFAWDLIRLWCCVLTVQVSREVR
jgi:hypothetical protein